jgi:hypothetical protein
MRATVKRPVRLDAVPDDFAATVVARGGELVNGALETVERVGRAIAYDVERQVVLVSTDFAFTHGHDDPAFVQEFLIRVG